MALQKQGHIETVSAAETANLAENLPDGTTVIVAAVAASKEEHLADLLIRICPAVTGGIVTGFFAFCKL